MRNVLLRPALLPLLAFTVCTRAEDAPKPTPTIEDSVVRIFTTARSPDLMKPWSKQTPRQTGGTGVIIEGKRILTNAHVVQYASQIQVQANQSGEKITATVEYFGRGIDLAMLKLEDESVFDKYPPLPRSNALPALKEPVTVYGYPTGGTGLSVTKGIVSRIEFVPYSYPVSGLRIQIDAAVNPGNSGGPVMAGDKVIGLAFSRLGAGDNIGYIIPSEEIDLFLRDVGDGRYDGKPIFLDDLQTLEHPSLRAFLKVDKGVEGIVVDRPDDQSPGYPLKRWDIITHIGENAVDNHGMIKLPNGLRVRFAYLLQKLVKDGKVPLRVIRQAKPVAIDLPVETTRPMLIPNLDGRYPSYFVYGPLVFASANSTLAAALLQSKASSSLTAQANPLIVRRGDRPAFEGEELVVVAAPLLPHRLSKGYSTPLARVVKSVNGFAVKNIRHLVELLRDNRDEFVVFEFDQHGSETIVFRRSEIAEAMEEILTDSSIRQQGSEDLMAVWNSPAKS